MIWNGFSVLTPQSDDSAMDAPASSSDRKAYIHFVRSGPTTGTAMSSTETS